MESRCGHRRLSFTGNPTDNVRFRGLAFENSGVYHPVSASISISRAGPTRKRADASCRPLSSLHLLLEKLQHHDLVASQR
ncbi:MAG: hypothetical protein WBM28_07940, partial [Burkholderiales bacterium]